MPQLVLSYAEMRDKEKANVSSKIARKMDKFPIDLHLMNSMSESQINPMSESQIKPMSESQIKQI